MKEKQLIVVGGTGQAKVIRSILDQENYKILGIFDDTSNLASPFVDVEILGKLCDIKKFADAIPEEIFFTIAVGNPHGLLRISLSKKLERNNLLPISLISKTAFIDKNVQIGDGIQVMPNSTIMYGAKIGKQCIINTKSSIDHDCIIEDGCEVGPGATLCGNVVMKTNSWIGAGATVLPRVEIGKNSIVGAGSVVVKSVPDNAVVVGNPARELRKI